MLACQQSSSSGSSGACMIMNNIRNLIKRIMKLCWYVHVEVPIQKPSKQVDHSQKFLKILAETGVNKCSKTQRQSARLRSHFFFFFWTGGPHRQARLGVKQRVGSRVK